MNYKEKYLKYKQKYTQLKSKFNIKNGGTIFNIPKIGLGTWQSSSDNEKIQQIIIDALASGYRCFDCALNYGNEEGIGKAFEYAFRNMGIHREDLFIIGKANSSYGIRESLSLKKLKLEYFDLALIHLKFDVPNEIWREFIGLKEEGKVINIGLSNIYLKNLIQFNAWCDDNGLEKPSAIENEINIINPEQEFVDYCNENDIKVIAYSPLVQMAYTSILNENDILNTIKSKYELSLAQLLLLWGIRRNITVIPGTSNKEHMKENLHVISLVDNLSILTDDEVNEITNCIGINYPSIYTAVTAKEKELL